MDREAVTGANGGGAQSYVKMLTPNYLTDLKNGGSKRCKSLYDPKLQKDVPTGVLSKINDIVNYINLHSYHTYVNKNMEVI